MGITQKVLLIVSVFSLLLSVSACSEKQKPQTEITKITTQVAVPNQDAGKKPFEIPTLAERTAWNLKLTVKEAHAGDEKIQANITDYDNQGFTLDLADFELERYNGSEWVDITDSTVLSNEGSILPQTDRNASVDFRIFVSQISKEPLEEGKYKLKGSVSGQPISAEFEVLP